MTTGNFWIIKILSTNENIRGRDKRRREKNFYMAGWPGGWLGVRVTFMAN